MKLKATKKQIKNSNKRIIKIGYCEMQYLLWSKEAFAYSVSVNGWACDYYNLDEVIISTGYNPIGTQIDYKTLQEYEKRASFIVNDYKIKYDTQKELLNNLLNDFLKEVL